MVPETVPICTLGVPPGKTTWVVLAATVKLAVRPPLINTTSGSSVEGASEAKVKVTVPVIASGYSLGILIATRGGCMAGVAVAGNPVMVADGPGGTPTVMVNDCVAVWPPPVTLTVKVNVPGAVGVPLRDPADEFSVIPPGSAPVEIDHVNVPFTLAAVRVGGL